MTASIDIPTGTQLDQHGSIAADVVLRLDPCLTFQVRGEGGSGGDQQRLCLAFHAREKGIMVVVINKETLRLDRGA
jgi:NAD(P)H-hydrate repair Nnr-like enzyme with NAD(P)H-hydrate epimerase domain